MKPLVCIMHMYCRLPSNTVYDIIKVNSNSYFLPSVCSILTFQSSMRSLTRAFRGAIYTAYKNNRNKFKMSSKIYMYKSQQLQIQPSPIPKNELTFVFGYSRKMRNIASSAATVFPEPVGAPSSTLQSV